MDNKTLLELFDQRSQLARLVSEATDTINRIDERIRMESGHDPKDFSGAVAKLRNRGILAKSK